MILDRIKAKLPGALNNAKSRKDLKSFIEFGVGYIVVLVVGFLLVRMINKTLTPVEMGKYAFIYSLVPLLTPFLFFCAPQSYLRFHQDHSISVHLRKFLLPAVYFAVACLIGIIYYYTRCWYAVLYAAFPIFTEKTYLLRCQMNTMKFNILRCVELFVPLCGILVLKHFYTLNANLLLLLYGLGYLTSYLFRASRMNQNPVEKKKVVQYLWPTVFTAVLGMFITNSAVILTKHYFGYEAAGGMGVATKALMFTNSMFTLFLMFFPMIYVREAEKGNIRLIVIYRRIIMLTALCACAFFAIFHKLVYWVIGAEGYVAQSGLFCWLLLVSFFNFTADIYWLYFSFEIKTWKSTLLKLASCLIIFGGCWYIPRGGIGFIPILLAIAVGITSVIGMLLALYSERKHFYKRIKS